MSNKMETVKERYSIEIEAIANRLNHMEQGLIMELTRVNMHGSLSTNVQELTKDINVLISKIVNESDSDLDGFDELFTPTNKK
ncbi:hypothetical protein SporoP8_13910 [Sporosarcina ureae]|uniref:hypothetical protein n=1 Tax=Sporosarcina ureae TaxID=1571 RepID=UPI000A16725C|nr:hypothetical protein [Sporosarcina ureae]ARJ39875.1 hypothetical protein SporoP8_13910 [Sporosarcina ureae]